MQDSQGLERGSQRTESASGWGEREGVGARALHGTMYQTERERDGSGMTALGKIPRWNTQDLVIIWVYQKYPRWCEEEDGPGKGHGNADWDQVPVDLRHLSRSVLGEAPL